SRTGGCARIHRRIVDPEHELFQPWDPITREHQNLPDRATPPVPSPSPRRCNADHKRYTKGRTLTPDQDVIVVGAGNAAFATAVSAPENGVQRVSVPVTSAQARCSGNANWVDVSLRLTFDDRAVCARDRAEDEDCTGRSLPRPKASRRCSISLAGSR